ncbi:tRNA-binding protein [Lysobacter pythonis]|uniref:tRNA-binding protein n=1 Tax=Solilutibacter pythonis TaxID=2483112 RepID=A0A3M2I1H0_9GAMM|nr:tRNA-binding protein [Lysobacter pythonis]RMH94988.1 tRNA-binding protein [Lysobacter pythonis]
MHETAAPIDWAAFQRVEFRIGTVVRMEAFPEARKPAWKVWVDFGPHGVRKTSAQIVDLYDAESLLGKQVLGVINFPPKRIAGFMSEFLLTGFHTDDGVVIATTERPVSNGARLA